MGQPRFSITTPSQRDGSPLEAATLAVCRALHGYDINVATNATVSVLASALSQLPADEYERAISKVVTALRFAVPGNARINSPAPSQH